MAYKKGYISWNKGLNKNIDERIKRYAEQAYKKRWNEKELDYLKDNFSNNTSKEIAQKLKRPVYDISNKAQDLSLKKSKEHLSKIGSIAGRKGGIKGGKSLIEKRKQEGTFLEFTKKGGRASIENFKRQNKFEEWRIKGNRKRVKLYKGTKKQREWSSKAGYFSFKKRKENAPYFYNGEKFLSNEELEYYKFYKKMKLSKNQINHEFRIKRCHIDFFPLRKFFHEHHPMIDRSDYDRNNKPRQYFLRRRKLLDENGYKGFPLIITKSMRDIPKLKKFMEQYHE